MKPLEYRGQRILLTGASSGLGVDFAHRLAQRGSDLVLVARREERLQILAEELQVKYGIETTVIAQDLAVPGVGALLRERLGKEGVSITGLVNNAGFGYGTAVHLADPERLSQMVRLNVDTLVDLTRTFLPDLREADGGLLVNVASVAAFLPMPGAAAYAASKSFVLSFTEALWEESRHVGLRVLALCPGPTHTEFFDIAGDEVGAGLPRMEAIDVVDAALAALEKRNPPPSVVPGVINAVSAQGPRRLLPTRFVASTVGAIVRRNRTKT
jgi:short-subunit dehydrogenase